ncbi:MAG: hypothetical protein HW411_1208 [Gammaproteobacteria bacterium]|nr:hypothetical protein [Gammaproteobacteria bacterium]
MRYYSKVIIIRQRNNTPMPSKISKFASAYFSISAVGLYLVLSLSNTVSAYEVYQYVVPDSELRIYPTDLSLAMRHQHAALNQIAEKMQAGTTQDLADFARISLHEMAGLFEEEAMRTFNGETVYIREGTRLNRWRSETLSYAQHLYNVADTITPLTSIKLYIENTGELHFVIEGDSFILSSPLIRSPKILDERIINSICRVKSCDPDVLTHNMEENTRTIIVQANWEIIEGNAPEFVTIDGLHFVFSDVKNRSAKQTACLQIIKEMRLIADTLKDAHDRGIHVDWDILDIKPLYGSYDYRITINRYGDSLYVKQVEDSDYQQYLYADELLAYAVR